MGKEPQRLGSLLQLFTDQKESNVIARDRLSASVAVYISALVQREERLARANKQTNERHSCLAFCGIISASLPPVYIVGSVSRDST